MADKSLAERCACQRMTSLQNPLALRARLNKTLACLTLAVGLTGCSSNQTGAGVGQVTGRAGLGASIPGPVSVGGGVGLGVGLGVGGVHYDPK